MSLEIDRREREGITILDLKGRLTVGEEARQLRDVVRDAAAAGEPKLILNLENVEYIDSSGLGTMVICLTTAQKANGTVKLLNLNKRAIELLVLTKLTTVFESYNDEQDAVNSFFPDRQVRKFDILSFVQQHREDPTI